MTIMSKKIARENSFLLLMKRGFSLGTTNSRIGVANCLSNFIIEAKRMRKFC